MKWSRTVKGESNSGPMIFVSETVYIYWMLAKTARLRKMDWNWLTRTNMYALAVCIKIFKLLECLVPSKKISQVTRKKNFSAKSAKPLANTLYWAANFLKNVLHEYFWLEALSYICKQCFWMRTFRTISIVFRIRQLNMRFCKVLVLILQLFGKFKTQCSSFPYLCNLIIVT